MVSRFAATNHQSTGSHSAPPVTVTGSAAHSAGTAPFRFSWLLVAPRVSLHDLELVHPLAAIFRNIDVALGVDRNAMRLIKLAGLLADAAEARHRPAGLAVDDVDLGVVLVDHKHVGLLRIWREIDCDGGAAELLDLAVRRHGDGRPRQLDGAFEAALLVIDLDAGVVAVANVDEAVMADRQAMHGLHAFRQPLTQEPAVAVHYGDAMVAVAAFAVRD